MLTYLRYALATTCFALSVACLGLWRWTSTHPNHGAEAACYAFDVGIVAEAVRGMGSVQFDRTSIANETVRIETSELEPMAEGFLDEFLAQGNRFGCGYNSVYFPLWFAVLSCTVAGVGCLRFPRRFTLRSAMIVTTVVAGLLGIVAAL